MWGSPQCPLLRALIPHTNSSKKWVSFPPPFSHSLKNSQSSGLLYESFISPPVEITITFPYSWISLSFSLLGLTVDSISKSLPSTSRPLSEHMPRPHCRFRFLLPVTRLRLAFCARWIIWIAPCVFILTVVLPFLSFLSIVFSHR